MPKTPKRRIPAVATRSHPSPRLAQRGTLNPSPDALDSIRPPPQIIHTYTRQKPRHRRASSLLSILSTFSNSLPPVEEVFSAVGKPLPPSAIDKINYHFRKLSKLVPGDAEQQFADETAAFQKTLDALYLEIIGESKAETEQLTTKTDQLSELAKVFERESQCAICISCICNPVTLGSCGHTFCALCIREQFRGRLTNNISRFRHEHDISDNITLPKTLAQRQKLTRLITSHHGDSSKIFSYQCPQCRSVVTEAPVVAYQFRSLLRAARAALSALTDTDDNLPTDEFPVTATFFDSLFE